MNNCSKLLNTLQSNIVYIKKSKLEESMHASLITIIINTMILQFINDITTHTYIYTHVYFQLQQTIIRCNLIIFLAFYNYEIYL